MPLTEASRRVVEMSVQDVPIVYVIEPVSTGGGGGGSGATTLDGLTDVTVIAPADRQALVRSASSGQWVNRALTPTDSGLGNVDNTADTAKPVSTAQQAAINQKMTDHVAAPDPHTQYALESALANVATSGAYTDLSGRPALAPVALSGAYTDLSGKPALAPVATSGAYADLSGKPTIPTTYADLSGTVPTSALPALAITEVYPVASQAAMLALTAQRGDVAIRSDINATFILATDSPTTLADWKQLPTPADAVLSVNSQTGVVVLAKGDLGLGNVDNTADLAKPISTATQTALDLKQAGDSDLTTFAGLVPTDDDVLQRKAGAWTNRSPAQLKTDLTLSNVDNTSDANKPISTATQTALNGKQAGDTDLTVFAGLTPTDGDLLQRVAGAWANRTIAQVKTDLAFTAADVGAVAASLFDTKGDLFAASAADTVVRHAAGTDGQTLVVDLSQTTGLRWTIRERGTYPLSADGLVGASGDLCNFRDNSSLGTPAWMVRIFIPAGGVITTCKTAIHAAGAVGAGGENSFAVYTDAGVLVSSTVSDDTLWNAVGVRSKALPAPIAAQTADRYVYVGIRVSGYSGPPSFAFFTSSSSAGLLDGGFGGNRRRSIVVGGSTWIASFDPTSFGSSSSGYMPFIAVA